MPRRKDNEMKTNETKHTPGKWKLRKGFSTDTIEVFIENPNIQKPFRPCSIAVVEADSAVGKANAARIVACVNGCDGIADPSAVRELLEALEACRDAIQRLAKESPNGVPMWASEAHDVARAAIAKARGENGGAL